MMSVNGRTGRVPDTLDFVFQHQFAALQFDDLEVVGGKMLEGIVQFVFQNFVFPFQFNEMRLNRHKKSPLLVDLRFNSGRVSVHERRHLSTGIKKQSLRYFVSSEMNCDGTIPRYRRWNWLQFSAMTGPYKDAGENLLKVRSI